jgi:DNA polymerase-1
LLAVKYKKASKLRGTYSEGLQKWIHTDGKIHTNYSPLKVTGRLGSNNPNIQNIPRPEAGQKNVREAFVPDCDDDVLLVVDYGQLEMRVLASLCEGYGDSTMAGGIRAGLDMHSFTGAKMIGITYEEFVDLKDQGDENILAVRQAAKAINFGIVYGIAAQGLSIQLSSALGRVVGEGEAQEYINTYFVAFPGVKMYMRAQKAAARNVGYVLTLAGRRRRLSAARSKRPQERAYAYRQAINAPVQGSAADIVKDAMIKLDSDVYLIEDLGCTIRMQVHDEFVCNVKNGAHDPERVQECIEIIRGTMESCFSHTLTLPLIADPAVVTTWSAAKG